MSALASVRRRVAAHWDGGTGRSNAIVVAVGVNDQSALYGQMSTDISSGQAGSTPIFTSTVFIPGEPVALWYNTPNGAVTKLATVMADGEGKVTSTFAATGFSTGSYTLVARGNWSSIIAVGGFEVR